MDWTEHDSYITKTFPTPSFPRVGNVFGVSIIEACIESSPNFVIELQWMMYIWWCYMEMAGASPITCTRLYIYITIYIAIYSGMKINDLCMSRFKPRCTSSTWSLLSDEFSGLPVYTSECCITVCQPWFQQSALGGETYFQPSPVISLAWTCPPHKTKPCSDQDGFGFWKDPKNVTHYGDNSLPMFMKSPKWFPTTNGFEKQCDQTTQNPMVNLCPCCWICMCDPSSLHHTERQRKPFVSDLPERSDSGSPYPQRTRTSHSLPGVAAVCFFVYWKAKVYRSRSTSLHLNYILSLEPFMNPDVKILLLHIRNYIYIYTMCKGYFRSLCKKPTKTFAKQKQPEICLLHMVKCWSPKDHQNAKRQDLISHERDGLQKAMFLPLVPEFKNWFERLMFMHGFGKLGSGSWDPDFGTLQHLELEEQVVQTKWGIKRAPQDHHDSPRRPPAARWHPDQKRLKVWTRWVLHVWHTSRAFILLTSAVYMYMCLHMCACIFTTCMQSPVSCVLNWLFINLQKHLCSCHICPCMPASFYKLDVRLSSRCIPHAVKVSWSVAISNYHVSLDSKTKVVQLSQIHVLCLWSEILTAPSRCLPECWACSRPARRRRIGQGDHGAFSVVVHSGVSTSAKSKTIFSKANHKTCQLYISEYIRRSRSCIWLNRCFRCHGVIKTPFPLRPHTDRAQPVTWPLMPWLYIHSTTIGWPVHPCSAPTLQTKLKF